MKLSEFMDDASIHQSNVRAEDGIGPRSSWNEFCKYVLIPIGTLFAVFLAMLGMMLLNH